MPYRTSHEWGPFIWGLIHTVSIIDFDEPQIQREHVDKAINILKNIVNVIPCPKCAIHYQAYIDNIVTKQNIYDKMELFKIMFEYHNQVNMKLGKENITYELALEKWARVI